MNDSRGGGSPETFNATRVPPGHPLVAGASSGPGLNDIPATAVFLAAIAIAVHAEDRPRRFFDYWSAKEAYIKARGLGLHIPLDAFDVILGSGAGPFPVMDRHTPAESDRWWVYPLNLAEGFAAAVAVDQPVRCFRLSVG